MNDEEIALSVQQGNTEALAHLVERHHNRLVGYLYMMGGDRALAEDLTQETFLKAVNGIATYDYPRPFKPWLYAIAANLARNHHNRAETRHPTDGGDALDGIADGADPIEASVAERGEIERMLALLDKLPALQREAILLRYVEGLSLAEMAEALDAPVGTIKSRISIGLSRLRTLMQDHGEL